MHGRPVRRGQKEPRDQLSSAASRRARTPAPFIESLLQALTRSCTPLRAFLPLRNLRALPVVLLGRALGLVLVDLDRELTAIILIVLIDDLEVHPNGAALVS
jgi:hypothetical protein